ncbi:MAG TPA: cytochrome c [Burkholderiales bacterium]|jgi:cytochrome c553|nr:cytochrome c [Burkholderiales bacterium]
MTLRTLSGAGLLACLAAVLAIAATPLHAEGDAAAGKDKTAMCAGCHGIPGFRTAYPETYQVPKLGGQNAAYLVAALKAYKAGERNHATMKAIAGSLTDQDMADLAAYYATAK